MKLHGYSLEKWLSEKTSSDFPNNRNYNDTYNEIKRNLRGIYKNITAYADKIDITSLTGHDEDHVNTVIDRASKLVDCEECELSPYEVYLLLCSILIHDVGNIHGRDNHELKIRPILDAVYLSADGGDSYEKNIMCQIAGAHGGKIDGSKDKIGKFIKKNNIEIYNESIKIRFLAAILRLADELADEPKRAIAQYIVDKGLIEKGSEIYQEFAKACISTIIDPNSHEISIIFNFEKSTAMKLFGKQVKEDTIFVYLLDEIFERILKTYLEVIYCQKFTRPYVNFDLLKVSINIFSDKFVDHLYEISIRIDLYDFGYPETPKEKLNSICQPKDLITTEGKIWTGEILKNLLEGNKLEINKNIKPNISLFGKIKDLFK